DLHAAHFRTAGDGATGKHRADHLPRRRIVAQPPAHVADDVVHMRVTLDRHQLVDLHAARHAHATEVVALQIDQHHVFGTLLGMADQFADARGVVVAGKTWPRTG